MRRVGHPHGQLGRLGATTQLFEIPDQVAAGPEVVRLELEQSLVLSHGFFAVPDGFRATATAEEAMIRGADKSPLDRARSIAQLESSLGVGYRLLSRPTLAYDGVG